MVTDPKGGLVNEVGNALYKNGYRMKIFNTINFSKSMHYNPCLLYTSSIMNDALPKKSKESKLFFSAKKLDKYFPPQYSTKERESIIIQLLEQWSADQVQSE